MKRNLAIATTATALFATMFIADVLRAPGGINIAGALTELAENAFLALAIVMAAIAAVEARDMRRERQGLLDDLAAAKKDGERWRQAARNHVSGLSKAIAQQFETWSLTSSEADVAGLLIKGLSHKEIAKLRQCSEATVRQHATGVYRKSGLGTRAQLTAFFLEDLLTPTSQPVAVTNVVSLERITRPAAV